MDPDERRSAWQDRTEAMLPIAGAMAAFVVMLMMLVA
jgi:hypothetical protein